MLTVLVVDDALSDRMLMSGLLTRALKCEVLQAANGRDAIAMIDESRPDVVLTDLNMPEMNGLELVSAVQENHPETPVILMTAEGSEEIAADALRQGAASFVAKTRCADDLADTVMRVLVGSRTNQLDPQVLHYLLEGKLRFSIRNDLAVIESLASLFQQSLRCLPLGSETGRVRVGLAIEAALSNACLRGNLEIRGSDATDRDALVAIFQERVNESPYRERRIDVTAQIDREQAKFVIRDEGPGFDTTGFSSVPHRLPAGDQSGRGIAMMQSIMDEVVWNAAGNEVTLVKRRYEAAGDPEE